MVEVIQFRPVPKRETVTWLRWRWSGTKSLPDPFGGDYKWQFVHFDLNFDFYRCPPGVITFEITSLNQLVALQLPFPIRVRKKKLTLKKGENNNFNLHGNTTSLHSTLNRVFIPLHLQAKVGLRGGCSESSLELHNHSSGEQRSSSQWSSSDRYPLGSRRGESDREIKQRNDYLTSF